MIDAQRCGIDAKFGQSSDMLTFVELTENTASTIKDCALKNPYLIFKVLIRSEAVERKQNDITVLYIA